MEGEAVTALQADPRLLSAAHPLVVLLARPHTGTPLGVPPLTAVLS